MSETEDVARRFVALWGDYLTALAADPKTAEPIRRWLGLIAAATVGGRLASNATRGVALGEVLRVAE